MALGKKGQMVFAGIMIAIMVFIVVVQLIKPIKDQVVTARADTALDCDNSSISTGTKATCIVVDFFLFYFVAMAIAAGVGYLFMKKLAPYIQ